MEYVLSHPFLFFLLISTDRDLQGIAQFGIIESVEMHQFMCHKFLSFKFGPQINFIIGQLFFRYLLRMYSPIFFSRS